MYNKVCTLCLHTIQHYTVEKTEKNTRVHISCISLNLRRVLRRKTEISQANLSFSEYLNVGILGTSNHYVYTYSAHTMAA